jgi:hypothetical protein
MLILNDGTGKAEKASFSAENAEEINAGVLSLLYRYTTRPNGTKPYLKFYKVFKYGTSVIEVLTNDFRDLPATCRVQNTHNSVNITHKKDFSLPDGSHMFYGYISKVRAMEYAKAGALRYISKLIEEGEKSHGLLLKYREAHYDDLNINLTDRNIRKIESELNSAQALFTPLQGDNDHQSLNM